MLYSLLSGGIPCMRLIILKTISSYILDRLLLKGTAG